MPVHDWTQLSAGDFHDFHQGWIAGIRSKLNTDVLPETHYAQLERIPSRFSPEMDGIVEEVSSSGNTFDSVTHPPQVAFAFEAENALYAHRKNRAAIHRASDHRVVAYVELVAPGDKLSYGAFETLIERTIKTLDQGIHVLLVDIQPLTARDPQGLHGAIWSNLGGADYFAPPDQPFTQAAYVAGHVRKAYVEPCSIGDSLTSMPLFLTQERYVPAPLEDGYLYSLAGMPRHLKRILEEAR